MLEVLYNFDSPTQQLQQVYMMLAIILVWTQDEDFNARMPVLVCEFSNPKSSTNIPKILISRLNSCSWSQPAGPCGWYKERALGECTLSDILAISLLRIASVNIRTLRVGAQLAHAELGCNARCGSDSDSALSSWQAGILTVSLFSCF